MDGHGRAPGSRLHERCELIGRRRELDEIAARVDAAAAGAGTTIAEVRHRDATVAELGGHCSLVREVGSWLATFDGDTKPLRASKGLDDLATLLARPHVEVAAVELAGAVIANDTGDVLDDRALHEVRGRLSDLERDIADAEAFGDVARAELRRAERDELVSALASAVGSGGSAASDGRRQGAGAQGSDLAHPPSDQDDPRRAPDPRPSPRPVGEDRDVLHLCAHRPSYLACPPDATLIGTDRRHSLTYPTADAARLLGSRGRHGRASRTRFRGVSATRRKRV